MTDNVVQMSNPNMPAKEVSEVDAFLSFIKEWLVAHSIDPATVAITGLSKTNDLQFMFTTPTDTSKADQVVRLARLIMVGNKTMESLLHNN